MTNAEKSGRRRRVIIMQNDDMHNDDLEIEMAPQASRAKPREPEPKRLRESDLPQSLLSAFRQACGQTSPLLIRISASHSGARPQTFLWDRPALIIGRGKECDLRLPHAEVSRQHAYLQIVNGRIHCVDLGSGAGTHWAHGANSHQHGWVESGEPVSIGPYSLTIEPAPQFGHFEASAESHEATDSDRVVPDGLFLDFRDGNNEPRRWPATRDVTIIGGGSGAKVKLVHSTVSKMHCAIVRADHALWVVDLLSDEGTHVNGNLVSVARLESGDEMKIGRFDVAAHYGSPLDDESIEFSSTNADVASRSASPNPTNELARLQQQALATAQKNAAAQGGISEQFVLDVINQMGVMQQQALQHAQQSMVQALQAVSATYQGRIETLESEYTSLKRQLRGLPDASQADDQPRQRGIPDLASDFEPLMPLPPNMADSEFAELPAPEHGSFECDDPQVKEQWVRDKMKLVEAELDKTRKGWGKRLIDLMGY